MNTSEFKKEVGKEKVKGFQRTFTLIYPQISPIFGQNPCKERHHDVTRA